MKNIELTEDHNIKLLEMCNSLFPEYKFTLEQNCQLGAYSYSFNSLVFSKLTEENHLLKGIESHWFEFCMTYLAKKLLVMYDFTIYQTTGNFMYVHPVDYLYKQFKN